MPTTPAQAAIAIGLMGGVFTAAAAAGVPRLRASLITAPTVVAPFTLWALRLLRRAGIHPNTSPRALMWFLIAVGTVHGIAHLATRVRENTAMARRAGH